MIIVIRHEALALGIVVVMGDYIPDPGMYL
jgi:hypothetical protein